jgi:general secretion pathway protein M
MKVPAQVAHAWGGLAPREKLLASGAATVIVLALVWWLAIGPALAVLRTSEAQHRSLDAQLARMQALQQQARALQSQPRQSHDDSLRALETAVRQRLGTTARTTVAGDRVTLTLAGTQPDALAAWLAEARASARALPAEARLTRGPTGGWDGTLVLTLPAR